VLLDFDMSMHSLLGRGGWRKPTFLFLAWCSPLDCRRTACSKARRQHA